MRSWTPLEGPYQGFLVTHAESISIADHLTLRKDGKVGWLLAESSTPDPAMPQDPCGLAKAFWGMGGSCVVVDVKGLKVGVVQSNPSGRDQFDKWATYRSDDGQVVTIAQDDKYAGAGYPALDGPVFTEQQLAELATDPRFRVGG